MLIYNYRSQDRRKVSWEFIARILVLATTTTNGETGKKWKWKSLKMCRIYIYTIFMHAHTSYSLADCVKVKKCAIIHEIYDLRSATRYLLARRTSLAQFHFLCLPAAISAINCRVWTYFWPFCQFSATHHATWMPVPSPRPPPEARPASHHGMHLPLPFNCIRYKNKVQHRPNL